MIYLIKQSNGKPVKSLNGEYLAYDTIKNAKRKIQQMQEMTARGQGILVYGLDTFATKDLKVYRV